MNSLLFSTAVILLEQHGAEQLSNIPKNALAEFVGANTLNV